ncbi:MAG TPA: L-serine ammonia-lyase [Syntrophorhabdaceae bacterium]|nr:L-serine ammonia-lyase [Syntrophorhabdaceae bacterium]
MMTAITTSVFELLKIGPGPSSSHTIGPMKAGYDFYCLMQQLPEEQQAQATGLKVHLFGSLAATGKGHGTDRAVLAGLLGHQPESCSPAILDVINPDNPDGNLLPLGRLKLLFKPADMIWDNQQHNYPYSNTIVIRLYSRDNILLEKEYYSVGGGFLQWKGWQEQQCGVPRYPYANAEQLLKQLKKHRLRLDELMLANEIAITGCSERRIIEKLDYIIKVMQQSVERGIVTEGFLPGPIGLHRKAALLYQRARAMPRTNDRMLVFLCAYAFAVAEENASGHIVVTAPTCGSAGVLPAVIQVLLKHQKLSLDAIRRALLGASAIGFIAKHNASISGAEVGCQGEIGVASSMAAALIALAYGCDERIALNGAEIALEHHLGMTCDPVKGYVQIPCIERNAMAAVKAWTAYLIAKEGLPEWHKVGLDKAIEAMLQTGRDMKAEYRETALGGLAKVC